MFFFSSIVKVKLLVQPHLVDKLGYIFLLNKTFHFSLCYSGRQSEDNVYR